MSKDAFPLRIQESERDIGGKKKGDLSELWVYAFVTDRHIGAS